MPLSKFKWHCTFYICR